jgi:hypothetical protein
VLVGLFYSYSTYIHASTTCTRTGKYLIPAAEEAEAKVFYLVGLFYSYSRSLLLI